MSRQKPTIDQVQDLETALASKAAKGSNSDITSMSGITGGISTVDYIDFDTTAVVSGAVGKLTWNDTDGTLDLGLKGGNVTLQVGQELVQMSTNISGINILNGHVVYITGAQGNRVTVTKAQANMESTSSKTFGIATENILNNQSGYITTFGLVRDLDTSAFTEGSALWLSATVSGGITATKPIQPDHSVLLGWCVRSHATVGSIFVNVSNGYELNELHDVLISGISNGQSLVYNSTTGLWENKTLVVSDISGLQTLLDGKASTSHTHTASQITDFNEAVDDRVGSLLVAGANVTLDYNDTLNTLTINSTGTGGGGGVTDHGALTGLGDDDHTQYHNDTRGDVRYYTKTLLDSGQLDTRYYTETEVNTLLSGKADTSHTHTSSQITDFSESVDDRVASLIQNGTGITWTYNDVSNTLTPSVSITQYTDELAQDAIGNALVDTTSINLTYDDVNNQIKADAIFGTTAGTIAEGNHTHATIYYTKTEVDTFLTGKQATLVSGTNIKTINGSSILGSGDLTIAGGGGSYLPLSGGDVTGNVTISGDLTVGDTVNPTGVKAYIKSGSSGRVWTPNANLDLTIESTTIAGINLIGGNASQERIYFSDTDAEAKGSIIYDHANDSMAIGTNGATQLSIDSTGKLTSLPTYNNTSTSGGNVYVDNTGKLFRSTKFHNNLANNKYLYWLGNAGAANFSTIGGNQAPSVSGSVGAVTPTFTTYQGYQQRVSITSASATTSSIAGIRSSLAYWVLGGSTADVGGVYFEARFMISEGAAITTRRFFAGLSSSVAVAPTDTDIVTNNAQFVGFGCEAADTNICFYHRGANLTLQKIDLGSGFPKVHTNATVMYEVEIVSYPSATTGKIVYYKLTNLNTRVSTSGSITGDGNITTLAVGPKIYTSAGGTSTLSGIHFQSSYIERIDD